MTATARPWLATKGFGGLGIKGSQAGKGEKVAGFAFSQQEDRDLIIKAVNSHDALVAALRELIKDAEYAAHCNNDKPWGSVTKARAALKLTEE